MSIPSVSTMPGDFKVGYAQPRWLDRKETIKVTHRIGVFSDMLEAHRVADQFADSKQLVAMVAAADNGERINYEVYGTSLDVAKAGGVIAVPDVALPSEKGKHLLIDSFTTGFDGSGYPLVEFGKTRWKMLHLAIGSMRERAPLTNPFKDFLADSFEQYKTGMAYLGRAMPDAMVIGIETAREMGPPGKAGIVAQGALGLAIDAAEFVPCLLFGAMNCGIAGIRSAIEPSDAMRTWWSRHFGRS